MAAGTTSTGKIAINYIEKMVDTFESQDSMLDMVTLNTPSAADLQNAGDVVWKDVQQHVAIFDGFDATGKAEGIITEQCPSYLGLPKNVLTNQQIDKVRDQRYWDRNAEEAGRRLASTLNNDIARVPVDTGGLFYRTNATSGYDAVAEAQSLQNERQLHKTMRYLLLNDRDNLKYAKDLAAKQTLQGQPSVTWASGQIGNNIAGYDIFNASFLKNMPGSNITDTTTTATFSAKPEGGTVNNATNQVTNIDYRDSGSIPVVASAAYAVGDAVKFSNSGTDVRAVGLDDKTDTNQAMTFKIVSIPNSTSINVWPKPIAADDSALTTLEKAYANIDTQIASGATVVKLNVSAPAKSNIFFDKSSIEVLGGTIPSGMLADFKGMKIINKSLKNGLTLYFMYDADLTTLQVQFRAFIWYGITNLDPSNNGSFVTF